MPEPAELLPCPAVARGRTGKRKHPATRMLYPFLRQCRRCCTWITVTAPSDVTRPGCFCICNGCNEGPWICPPVVKWFFGVCKQPRPYERGGPRAVSETQCIRDSCPIAAVRAVAVCCCMAAGCMQGLQSLRVSWLEEYVNQAMVDQMDHMCRMQQIEDTVDHCVRVLEQLQGRSGVPGRPPMPQPPCQLDADNNVATTMGMQGDVRLLLRHMRECQKMHESLGEEDDAVVDQCQLQHMRRTLQGLHQQTHHLWALFYELKQQFRESRMVPLVLHRLLLRACCCCCMAAAL